MNNMYNEIVNKYTIDNGLEVLIIHKADYVKSHCLFLTPFGAQNTKMVNDKNEVIEFKSGLAHFLEHKMFESKKGDVSLDFSKMGISSNAFTSYTETAYYFSTSFEISKPLNLLLDFVQDLYITKKSVEKEKGIIVQELKMYQNMADSRFVQELFLSLFSKHPLSLDVGGTEDSVNSVTVDDLKTCYSYNYHPSNMLLIVVSNESDENILELVKNNQSKKKFPKIKKLSKFDFDEPLKVNRETFEFKMDVTTPRFGMGFKEKFIKDPIERFRLDTALKIALEAYLSSSNIYVQKWLDERLINDSFFYDSEIAQDYGYIAIISETENKDTLKEEILKILKLMKDTKFSEELLIPIKRRLIGSQIMLMNSFEDYAIVYARSLFSDIDFFESLEILKSISAEDINKALAFIDFENMCEVTLNPEK